MTVVDASVAVGALLGVEAARQALIVERVDVPHLIDAEVAHTLRRLSLTGQLTAAQGGQALERWRSLGMARHQMAGLLERVWELRQSLSAYDATYVALAEVLGTSLLTADARISRAPGLRCPVTVVPG